MLRGKNILIGITGGIAAYKIPFLVRQLKKKEANVRIVMTEHASYFVTPLTLSTLSGFDVVVGTFPTGILGNAQRGTWHVKYGQWADLMVIAPATANIIAKLAHGLADNAVVTLALSLRCPLLVAPAMDEEMWEHPATQENLAKLLSLGYTIVPPRVGDLASGLIGKGRMNEPKVITQYIEQILDSTKQDLHGKKILVTAGPTYEPIDPVRFIGNRSSGKMGFALASVAFMRGADVVLVSGPVNLPTPRHIKRIDVETTREMFNAVKKYSKSADIIIMAAAVADFAPMNVSLHKIKKEELDSNHLQIRLKSTPDILQSIGKDKKGKILVGFALETENELSNAKLKLQQKNLDFIVVNNPLQSGSGFGVDTNIVTIVSRSGKIERLNKMSKYEVANRIIDRIVNKIKMFS